MQATGTKQEFIQPQCRGHRNLLSCTVNTKLSSSECLTSSISLRSHPLRRKTKTKKKERKRQVLQGTPRNSLNKHFFLYQENTMQGTQCFPCVTHCAKHGHGPCPQRIQLGEIRHCCTIIAIFSDAVVLNQGQFCPPGNIWQCLETFWAVTAWGRGFYWYLVGRSQGCYKTLDSAQTTPTTKNYPAPSVK